MNVFVFALNIVLITASGLLRIGRYMQIPLYGELRVKVGSPGIHLHLAISFDFEGIILIDSNCGKRDRVCPRYCEDNGFTYLYCHPNCKVASTHENALICNAREPTMSDEVTIVVHRYNPNESTTSQPICSKCNEWRGKAAGCRPLFGRLWNDTFQFPRISVDEDLDEIFGLPMFPNINLTLISSTGFDRRALTKPDGLFGLNVGTNNPVMQIMKRFNISQPVVSLAYTHEAPKYQGRSTQILSIGYLDKSRCGPFSFIPTATKDKWVIEISSIEFMGMNLTGPSLGVISQDADTIRMPHSAAQRLTERGPITLNSKTERITYYQSPCIQIGYNDFNVAMKYGNVKINVKSGLTMTLTAKTLYFRRPLGNWRFCVLSTTLDSSSPYSNSNAWILGTAIMNDYCIALDYRSHEIGFAPLRREWRQ